MNITFRQIDAFRTVVSTGTVTTSAQMLGISQPAVSRLISDLEKEVGFRLFVRSGRNLKPTLEARLLVDEVRRALSGLEHIKSVARSIRQFQHAQIRIITTPAFATMLVPGLIDDFAARRPDAMISLDIQSTDDTVEWMVSQNHDFGIAPPTDKNPNILSRPLLNAKSVCIVPKNHRLKSKKRITPEDLEGESFVSFLPDSIYRYEIDQIFRSAGVKRRLQYEARTTDAVCDWVAKGLGVSIIGAPPLKKSAGSSFVAIPFTPTIPFRAALMWSGQKTMSAVAEDFLDMVESTFSGK